MAITLIRKRGGSITDFDRSRIETAIKKAYIGANAVIEDIALSDIVDDVLISLGNTSDENLIPTVEDVQNLVEIAIAKKGDFEVAKAYIIYRLQHSQARSDQQQALIQAADRGEIKVKKRSGKIVSFDLKEIEKALENVCQGYEKCIDVPEVVNAIKLGVYDGITTAEINKVVVMTLKTRIEHDSTFSFLTARFLANDIYKEVVGVDEFSAHFTKLHQKGFAECIADGIEKKRLEPRLAEFDLAKLAAELDTSRDRLFEFMGLQVLYDRYFLRDADQALIETPQYFWMRVAMGFSLLEEDKDAKAIEFYHTLSQLLYVPSTPTLLHSGTHRAQMSSCFLSTTEDDLKHIFKVIGDNAQMSKWSGGVANDWTNIRATNALVKTINTGSQGVIPFLKIVDATTASINRSGKRRGATCVYLETWHMDIEQFLDLRKNTGDERLRTHDTNTANWIPDLFMKRVQEEGEWTLFSPEEVPDLHDSYGKAFEEKYIAYEAAADRGEIGMFKRMKAQDLWRKMIMMLFETGHPWMVFKDPGNIRSPQDHVGVIHSSNLCTEIFLNTSAEETAVCNIGSVNLARHVQPGGVFDWKKLEKTVKSAIRMLDNVIDGSFYPTIEGKHSNMRHRPIGLGIMGTQDTFFELDLNFDSIEAVNFSDNLMEFISYHAILTSSELAKEKGAYESFKGSKWDRNIFPVDTIALLEEQRGVPTGIAPIAKMDWTPVREHVKKHGMRNSNTMAIAPTATISNIAGCLPSIEPIYKNIYAKSNFSGEFTIVNSYLINDLKAADLWDGKMLDKLKYYEGNLQNISEIPQKIKDKYKETFQIDPYWTMAHAAHRGKWIDQSQSINIFISTESGRAISDAYMMAWKMGLKSTYYLRTLAATAIEKSTIDINKKYDDVPTDFIVSTTVVEAPVMVATSAAPMPKLVVLDDGICESCQ
jgi:ribonucleoside-diphosphate reductase alpha chain